MSHLRIFEFIGLFVNILIADDNYSLRNRGDVWQRIQMQFSKIKKSFSQFFAAILKLTRNY